MDVEFCENKNEWDEFILKNSNSFLQSFEWGEIQKKSFKKIFRFRVYAAGSTLIQAQIIIEKLSFKNFLYIPYGPVFNNNLAFEQKKECFNFLINKIKKISRQENCFFLRIEPVLPIEEILKGKIEIPLKRIQPQKTLILDITKSEEGLLKNFSSGTRRNIVVAKHHGVEIEKQNGYSEDFYKLINKTKDRQEFRVHKEEYYKNILNLATGTLKSELFLAKYNGKTINATLVIFWGKRAITLHTGSDYEYRPVKGANLLRWEIIREAKSRGFSECDFWGIDEKRWPNLTAFKKGFGGNEVEYPAGADIIFQKFWYCIYKTIKTIREKK